MSKIKIYLAQINSSVGDLEFNKSKILEEFEKAKNQNCDLIIFPESVICGYPCHDLWQKDYFIFEIEEKITEIIKETQNSQTAILFGAPIIDFDKNKKRHLKNSALLVENGKLQKIITKKNLPNYGVFDEKRYFKPANNLTNFTFRGITFSALICEDLWDEKNLLLVSEQISDCIISINSSPFEKDKQEKRFEKAQKFSKNLQKPLIYVNQIGGQDSLIFDGKSFVLDEKGQQKLVMKEFCEDSKIIEISKNSKQISIQVLENQKAKEENLESAEKIYSACILGLRDYIEKSGFKKILLGMSGGIDSALVASIAADALGTKNIELYALPSRYNSKTSFDDAINYSRNLEIELKNISIEKIFSSFLETMPNISSLAQENLQSRIRGNILMSLSNSTGALLLSTGNKSELAVGYATIYGDMCGAYNPIKDIYKSEIFELAKWRNKNIPTISKFQKTEIIPENIIIKEPTAELRENQKDSDSLPDYKILDQILFSLIEEEKSIQETIENGFDDKLVKKVAKLFYANEYKRKQAVLGPKISKMSFDLERRYPIINKFTF